MRRGRGIGAGHPPQAGRGKARERCVFVDTQSECNAASGVKGAATAQMGYSDTLLEIPHGQELASAAEAIAAGGGERPQTRSSASVSIGFRKLMGSLET